MSVTLNNNFPKYERLCGQLRIADLYKRGKRLVVWPLRVTYLPAEDTQVLVWAPKSLFKHAVDRNRVKRQVREAYRHHKQILTEKVPQEQTLALAFIWLTDKHHESVTVEKSVKRLLGKVADRL